MASRLNYKYLFNPLEIRQKISRFSKELNKYLFKKNNLTPKEIK